MYINILLLLRYLNLPKLSQFLRLLPDFPLSEIAYLPAKASVDHVLRKKGPHRIERRVTFNAGVQPSRKSLHDQRWAVILNGSRENRENIPTFIAKLCPVVAE